MSTSNKKSSRQQAVLIAIFVLLSTLTFYYYKSQTDITKKKSINRLNAMTFNVPDKWMIYKTNQAYDFDVGYFKNGNKKEQLLCNINVVTTKLNRTPTFQQFLQTSLSGQTFIKNHKEGKIANQDAWMGTYAFSAPGIEEPGQNERILFVYNGIYTDITLSYSQNSEKSLQESCSADFNHFIADIELM